MTMTQGTLSNENDTIFVYLLIIMNNNIKIIKLPTYNIFYIYSHLIYSF